ncbi:MAG: hypothetical protein ACREOC_03515 [Gemmatimonadales bacterium]
MPSRPPYPLGLPLTDSMELTARDGTCWLAYIEGIPSPPPRRWRRQTRFPARRLRFDSVYESRATTPVPAGAPFLTEVRLQELLDRAAPLQDFDLSAAVRPDLRRRIVPSATRAARLAAAVLAAAAVAQGGRRRRRVAERRRTLLSRAEELVAGASDRLIVWVAGFLRGRPRARF